MKFIKALIIILILAVIGALVFIYWPKIRECCDRLQACRSSKDDDTPIDDSTAAADV